MPKKLPDIEPCPWCKLSNNPDHAPQVYDISRKWFMYCPRCLVYLVPAAREKKSLIETWNLAARAIKKALEEIR